MLRISYHQIYSKKINFTQMGRYSDGSKQRFRQLFEREFNWMLINLFLMRQRYYPSLSIGLLKVYLDNIYFFDQVIKHRDTKFCNCLSGKMTGGHRVRGFAAYERREINSVSYGQENKKLCVSVPLSIM